MTELLQGIKERLGITGEYHDKLLTAYADDVKAYMLDAGVLQSVIDSDASVGVISRGVADLWNYGAGDGKFSEVFYQRLIQLSLPGGSSGGSTCKCPTLEPISTSEVDDCTKCLKD